MAYLRKDVSTVTNIVTASEIGLKLNTPATANLAGTISTQQFQLADAFTLTGDLTVNDDLFLGKVNNDGTGQSIAGAGNTITGTGSITMGSAVQQTSVDGMTGALRSAVTFPAGHVLQVKRHRPSDVGGQTSDFSFPTSALGFLLISGCASHARNETISRFGEAA